MPEPWVERVPDSEQARDLTVEPMVDLSAEPARDVLPESLAAMMAEPPPESADQVLPELLTDRSRMLADRLAADLAGVSWPAPEQIRDRARRRTRRTAVSVPTAVVLVIAAFWGLAGVIPGVGTEPETVGGRPGADTPGSAPSSPSRVSSTDAAWIPSIALLQPADLGLNFRISDDRSGPPGVYPDWPFRLDQNCPRYAGLRVVAYRDYRYSRGHSIGGDTEDGRWQTLTQQVIRYADGGTARTVVDDVRRVVDACRTYDVVPTTPTGYADPTVSATPTALTTPNGNAAPATTTGSRHAWQVLDDGFAGTQSLLVRQQVNTTLGTSDPHSESETVTLYAVVRVGDLVAVLESYDYDDARMRQLADRAAAWLCPFANPRC